MRNGLLFSLMFWAYCLVTVPVEGATITTDTVLDNHSRFYTLNVKNGARVDMFNGFIERLRTHDTSEFHLHGGGIGESGVAFTATFQADSKYFQYGGNVASLNLVASSQAYIYGGKLKSVRIKDDSNFFVYGEVGVLYAESNSCDIHIYGYGYKYTRSNAQSPSLPYGYAFSELKVYTNPSLTRFYNIELLDKLPTPNNPLGWETFERVQFHLIPENNRPIADAGADIIAYAWIDGVAEVTLDGTESYDIDGDKLFYFWYNDLNELIARRVQSNVLLGAGEYEVTLVVNDGLEDSEPNSCMVTVFEAIETAAKLTPQSLNRKSNRPHIIGKLTLMGFSQNDIDPNEPMVLIPGNIEAERIEILPSKEGADSITLKGFFDNAMLMDAIEENGDIEVTITTRLLSGQWVYGTDTVMVK